MNCYIFNNIYYSKNRIKVNKLFCTFVKKDELDCYINNLNKKYTILYNKIFVLEFNNENEFILTYNTEQGILGGMPKNTILVHRKKESNTLYTINALNNLIKSINNGFLDKNYKINWLEYQNSVLLSSKENPGYNRLNTKLDRIIKVKQLESE